MYSCRVVMRIYAPSQRTRGLVYFLPGFVGSKFALTARSMSCAAARTTILRVLVPGEVISYLEMCREEGVNLQRGMNFGSSGRPSVILMSRRPGAPYDDRVEDDGGQCCEPPAPRP